MRLISKGGFGSFCMDNFMFFIHQDKKYKDHFFKTNLEIFAEISKEEYMRIKFGKAWQTVESAYTECIHVDNGEYLTCAIGSPITHHDMNGNQVKEYNIGHFEIGFAISYGIAINKNGKLWIAQPMSHYIGQFDLETENELFRIGGDYEDPDTFDHPEQVRVFGDFVFVCDMINQRMCKIHTETKEFIEYKTFEDNVWDYGQFRKKEIIKLTAGIYEL